MADDRLKNHKITYDDGTVTYLLLDGEGAERWKRLADDKTTTIKSVAPGEPTPINAKGAGS